MNRSVISTWLLATIVVAAGGGCEKEEVPEHVQQQRRQRALRAKGIKAKRPHRPGGLGGHPAAHHGGKVSDKRRSERFDDRKWPPAVRRAMLALFDARPPQTPRAAQRLARLGPAAFEALRYVATHPRLARSKRAAVGFLYVAAQIFRPAALAKLGGEPQYPYIQRAAIQALARLRDKRSKKLLAQLREREAPMAQFIDWAATRPALGVFSAEQLKLLDRVLHPEDVNRLRVDLLRVKTLELEAPLLEVIRSPVSSRVVQGLVAQRLVTLAAAGARKKLHGYAAGQRYPAIVRVAAAKLLAASKRPGDRALVQKLAADRRDPLAPVAKKLLAKP